MTISNFARLVSKDEAKKAQVNIAQISEILKVINKLTNGNLYAEIKQL